MENDIDAAVAEIVDLIQANITDIRFTPDDPPEGNERWPMCLVYGSTANYATPVSGVMTGLHGVTIMLLVPRDYKRGLADAHSLLTSLQDDIPQELLQGILENTIGEGAASSVISTFGSIDMVKQFGIDYEGTDCIAAVYTINDLKIMETL